MDSTTLDGGACQKPFDEHVELFLHHLRAAGYRHKQDRDERDVLDINVKPCLYCVEREYRPFGQIMLFLHRLGASTGPATRIFKTFGNLAIQTVQENTCTLAKEIHGIGFAAADQIAQSVRAASVRQDGLASSGQRPRCSKRGRTSFSAGSESAGLAVVALGFERGPDRAVLFRGRRLQANSPAK